MNQTAPLPVAQGPRVVVVGGGLAGLAAAAALLDAGLAVTILEGRRRAGGRAASFDDPVSGGLVDACQHVAMGCCTNFLDLCRRAGIDHALRCDRTLWFIGPDGDRSRCTPSRWLPAPLHLAPLLFGMRHFSLREKAALAAGMLRLARVRPRQTADTRTALGWLRAAGQPPRVIELFWQPVIESALGESIDLVSVAAARKVAVDGFLAHRDAADLVVPTEPLGILFGERLVAWLASRGATVRTAAAASAIERDTEGLVVAVRCGDEQVPCDAVVLAVPWKAAGRLVPDLVAADDDRFAGSPITAVHLWFDRGIVDLPHAVLVGRVSQWVFRGEDHAGDGASAPGYCQVVISASRGLMGGDREAVVTAVVAELREIFPAARDATLIEARVVTDPTAVLSVRPGVESLRPGPATAAANLFLAGDWTDTGWPSTMEGAIRSGRAAADAVAASLGRRLTSLTGDLPKNLLVRLVSAGIFMAVVILAGLTAHRRSFAAEPRATHNQGAALPEPIRRALELPEKYRGLVARERLDWKWLSQGDAWYRVATGKNAFEFYWVDCERGTRRPLVDRQKLALNLAKTSGVAQDAAALEWDGLSVEHSAGSWESVRVAFRTGGRRWLYEPAADRLTEVAGGGPGGFVAQPTPKSRAGRPRRSARNPSSESPDGRWRIELRDEKAWLVPTGSEDRHAMHAIELPGQEPNQPLLRGPFQWSPDSTHVVGWARVPGERRRITLIDSRPDDQLQPKRREVPYDKPGDRIEIAWPRLFEIGAASAKAIPIATDRCANPWSIEELEWAADGGRLTFWYIERGHQCVRWLAVDAASGHVSVLIEETSPTFIDYAHKMERRKLESSAELIWMSERSGWCHLDLHDATTGARKHPITSGPWVVRGIERIDEASGQLWISAGGFHPGEDPYHRHLVRVGMDGSDPVPITQGDGDHEWNFSDDGRFILDRCSRVDLPPVHRLIDAHSGRVIIELEQADWSALLAAGWQAPVRFVAKGRDGKTDIHGIIHRPSGFREGEKYPVIEQIYAGPQEAHVPKDFGLHVSARQLAELGFIVVQIDGMGTSHRSKAFHDVCWKNLADAGFPDRRVWMEAAARQFPSMDLSRVGITGGSAGGQNALGALLFHGDFYDVAVADSGCHDNRLDKIWWNELWMGWPVGEHYAAQSNVVNAHRLQGQLLLIVGELDDNVDPASTLQVVDALIAADKDFDLLWMPGLGHGAGSSDYGCRRTWEFFLRHLKPESVGD